MSQTTPRSHGSVGTVSDRLLDTEAGFEQDEELIDDLGMYGDSGGPAALGPTEQTDQADQAGRRPSTRTLVIAAAVGLVVLVVVGVLAFVGLRSPDPGTDGTDGTATPANGSVATQIAGPLHVQRSTTPYTDDNLATRAALLLAQPGEGLDLDSEPTKDLGPLATKAGLDACAAALGEADAARLVVDLASFDGQPAAIVVATRGGDDPHTTAYAVARGCATGDPKILRDGVPVS